MPRWLETDTLTDHDVSSAHEVGSYTCDADRLILAQVLIDTAAGNGDYVFYATLQVGGAGSAYILIPKTTAAAASGETAIGAQSIFVAMKDDDVLKVYIDALAGDTSVDVYCRFFELQALKATTADRTLDVSSGGEAGVDWANVGSPTTTVGLTGTTLKLTATGIDEILDEVVEGSLTMRQILRLFLSALAGKAAGGGTTTITFRDNADSKARITATVDANGNRTAVTLDAS